jgi:CRP-like cAMP-binding protein
MLLQDEVNLLRGIPLFASIETMRLKLLAFACDRVTYAAGSMLFRQGDAADATYVILSGRAEILHAAGDGPVKTGEAGTRSVVGETALVSDRPRTQTLRALTEVETLRISHDTFQKLLTCCPGSLEKVVAQLGDRMAKAS